MVCAVSAAVHRFLWMRLVRDTGLRPPLSRALAWLLGAFGVLVPMGMVLTRMLPRTLSYPMMWVLYPWMGLIFLLVGLLLPFEAFHFVHRFMKRKETPPDPERRQFLYQMVGAGVSVSAFGLAGVGIKKAFEPVAVKLVRVALPRLARPLSGYTLVQLTDVHIGPTLGRAFLEEVVEKTNTLSPDAIAITGDLVDGSVEQLAELVAPLARLRARDGVYFVTGNHEYYSGAEEWIVYLQSLGLRVLRNQRVSLQGENGFDLGGVDDWNAPFFAEGHGMDMQKVIQGRDSSRPLILLAHQPRAVFQAAQAGVDLQLSGHTHGGQLVPFDKLVALQQPYVKGLHQHGPTQVYVSCGTGYWGPPMRLGTTSEITRIVLEGSA